MKISHITLLSISTLLLAVNAMADDNTYSYHCGPDNPSTADGVVKPFDESTDWESLLAQRSNNPTGSINGFGNSPLQIETGETLTVSPAFKLKCGGCQPVP